MLVEIMRAEVGVPHLQVGGVYKGPYPSGAPCIFIDSAARMAGVRGLTTGFIGTIGDDDFGVVILNKMKDDGVDCSQVATVSGTTGAAFVQYNEDGSRKFIFAAGAAGMLTADHIDPAYFEGVKDFHVMGSALSISPTSKDAVMKAIDLTIENGGIVSFDPNIRKEMAPLEQIKAIVQPVIAKTTILLPSGEEAMLLTGDETAEAACQNLLTMGPEIVVLKQAAEGCTVYTADGSFHVPAFPVTQVDPTGAGDSFGGAFVVEHLAGTPIENAAKFANAVGALKVTSFGPMASHSRAEVEEFMASN
jgi:sugar/nucleoside kinase (ribokinase family)